METFPNTDQFYDYDNIIRKPDIYNSPITETLPENLLKMKHSFGWQRLSASNFCLLKEDTVAICAGCVFIIYDLKTGSQRIFPTVCGKGAAHITAHPSRSIFAVAEKGSNPTIDIFTYPNVLLQKLLSNGSDESYVYTDFDSSGNLLASVSSSPNYSIIIWNWTEESIILKAKAFESDVWKVKFSPFACENIITSGVSHIKFWKMMDTFTGLKLKGQLGKFGRTDVSDIRSFVQLKDGKVLSTSDWGNVLVWEDGILRAEICQKERKPCHTGNIHQIILKKEELLTIGDDGWIKTWDIERIEMINKEEGYIFIELEPYYKLLVSDNADLRCVIRSEDENVWYCYNCKGFIWKLNLSSSSSTNKPEIVRMFPVVITGCDFCRNAHIMAVTSSDGILRLYNCLSDALIASYEFHQIPTVLIWGSKMLDPENGSLILGFEDGVIRWMVIKKEVKPTIKYALLLHQVVKSHTAPVTCIHTNFFATRMVSGSLDLTIFHYFLRKGEIKPMGFINIGHPIRSIFWLDRIEIIVAICEDDILAASDVIKNLEDKEMDRSTYQLSQLSWKEVQLKNMEPHEKMSVKIPKEFTSTKSFNVLEEEHFEDSESKYECEDDENKSVDTAISQTEGDTNDEKVSKSEENKSGTVGKLSYSEYEKFMDHVSICLPKKPFNITCGVYTGIAGKFWLCMGGNNKGFLYEYSLSKDIFKSKTDIVLKPVRILPMLPSEFDSISCLHITPHRNYLITGQNDGRISVYSLEKLVKSEDIYLTSFWSSGIHDFQEGSVKFITSSHDGRLLATAGEDGNLFLFYMNAPKHDKTLPKSIKIPISPYYGGVANIEKDALSLEETLKKTFVESEKQKILEEYHRIEQQMKILRINYEKLTLSNSMLPKHMQLDLKEFSVHDRIKSELENQMKIKLESVTKETDYNIAQKTALLDKLKTVWKDKIEQELVVLTSFLTRETVFTSKMTTFPLEEYATIDFSELDELKELEIKSKNKTSIDEEYDSLEEILKDIKNTDEMEDSNDEDTTNASTSSRFSTSYKERLSDDLLAKILRKNLGYYKLKIDNDYVPPEYLPLRSRQKIKQLLRLDMDMNQKKIAYNNEVMFLKSWKDELINKLEQHSGFVESKSSDTLQDKSKILSSSTAKKLLEMQSSIYEHKCCKNTNLDTVDSYDSSCCPRQIENKFTHCVSSSDFLPEIGSDITSKLKFAEKLLSNHAKKCTYMDSLKEIWIFDSRLHLLRLNRSLMDRELKYSNIKRMTYFFEHKILNKYEQQEESLNSKFENRNNKKKNLRKSMKEQLEKSNEQSKIILQLDDELKTIQSSLAKVLSENKKFSEFLTTVFNKNISLRKDDESDVDEGHDSDDNKSDFITDEDNEDSDWIEVNRPPECNPQLIESVQKLKEKKIEVEKKIKKAEKLQQTHKLEYDILYRKLRTINDEIYSVKRELNIIQLQKQKELNDIKIPVNLFLHQIQHCAPKIPADLSTAILFPVQAIEDLKERKIELNKQCIQRKHDLKGLHAKETTLKKEYRIMNEKVKEMDKKLKVEMLSKLGQVVDLEDMEKRLEMKKKDDVELIELKKRQAETLTRHEKAIKEWKKKVQDKHREYYRILAENTKKIQILAALKRRKMELDARFENLKKLIIYPKCIK